MCLPHSLTHPPYHPSPRFIRKQQLFCFCMLAGHYAAVQCFCAPWWRSLMWKLQNISLQFLRQKHFSVFSFIGIKLFYTYKVKIFCLDPSTPAICSDAISYSIAFVSGYLRIYELKEWINKRFVFIDFYTL